MLSFGVLEYFTHSLSFFISKKRPGQEGIGLQAWASYSGLVKERRLMGLEGSHPLADEPEERIPDANPM